jgi:alpha-L-rhamnosidase
MKVRAVSAVSSVAVAAVPKLEVADNELVAIDRISKVTLRDCMQIVFEDGPRRDRRVWLGDLRLQVLANHCTFKDSALVKRCPYLFAALP